ncbi:MAG: hypothetical protein O2820_26260 [Planctomycetota bacterium]|nr:hypothetical protein [Planctomycetota bacterium]MDA1252714.1 hypothetical protein [Planctomycetota bacterium]
MSELSEDHISEQQELDSGKRSFRSIRGFVFLAIAAAAIPVCYIAFSSSDSSSGVDIPLSQLEQDLAGEDSSEFDQLAEPGRLVSDATATAIEMPGQSSTVESAGPLFGDPLSSATLSDSTSSEGGSASIEVTRFRPTSQLQTGTQRAQANQAVWLTGSIEPVD